MSKNGSDQARTAMVLLAPMGGDPAGATPAPRFQSGYPDRPGARQQSGRIRDLGATRRGRAPTKRRLPFGRPSRPMTH